MLFPTTGLLTCATITDARRAFFIYAACVGVEVHGIYLGIHCRRRTAGM